MCSVTMATAATLVAGCVAGTTPGSTATRTLEGTATGGHQADPRVVGLAESVDDVGSQDRVPMTEGTLLAVPVAEAETLWELLGASPRQAELPYLGGILRPADVERWPVAPIRDGEFALDVPDGAYVVCLMGGEFVMQGCGEAAVAGPTRWSVSAGEGGVEVDSDARSG